MSNLLQKASIITTPTAYDTGKILSVKPVETYGPELVTNGDFATDSDWILENGAVINNDSVNIIGVGSRFRQDVLIVGKSYRLNYQVVSTNGSAFRFQDGVTAFTDINQTVGYHIYYFKATGDRVQFQAVGDIDARIDNVSVKEALNADFDFQRNSSATRVGSNGLIQDVASNLPRIDYTGGVGSWKFEPQRTNEIIYSEDFSQWNITNSTISLNQSISPDGTLNADEIADSSNAYGNFSTNITSFSSSDYSISLFIKKKQTTSAYLGIEVAGNGSYLTFNSASGDLKFIGTNVFTNKKLISFNSDWWYLSFNINIASSNSTTLRIFPSISTNGSTLNAAANGTENIWGAQVEEGSYQTSYIRSNTGSATTRLADVANNAGSSDLINSTEGVLYAEISALADDSTNRQMTLSDGTNTNRLVLKYDNQSNIIQSFNRVGGVESAFLSATILDITLFSKCLVKYKENDYQLWINGYKLDTDTNSTVWPSSTLNDFKINEGGGADFFGNVKCLSVFKEALTDLELECLVSWMSFSDLGINFGYTVE